MDEGAAIAVVVVCHDSEAGIGATIEALVGQLDVEDELVVVDNASADRTIAVVGAAAPDVRITEAGGNVGFAAGCQLGARATQAPLLLFLNPDAVPAPGCVDALRACAVEQPAWGAWQALVTLQDGRHINTSGNLVHWLGFGWAAGLGEPVERAGSTPREVGFASGAAMVVRRSAWDATGGFDERYFMYGEDLDLSLRLRLAGWSVGVVPAARVAHDYAFAKGDYKWFLLERNRWWTVLGDYPLPLLLLVVPALLAFEVALLPAAWKGNWLSAKLRAQVAVLKALPVALRRRRAVQRTRTITSWAFACHLTDALDSPHLAAANRVTPLAAAQRGYWRLVKAAVR
jgi:N-acetylglucosaminyl-diphospho-decaprenol L-rhamnosyltransferase